MMFEWIKIQQKLPNVTGSEQGIASKIIEEVFVQYLTGELL